MDDRIHLNYAEQSDLELSQSDYALVSNPLLNKGMAFTEAEREAFHLYGLLPPHVATLDEQRDRSYEVFKSKTSDLEKYIYLRDLQDSNEVLFYNLLNHHLTEMLPIVYTPTVGLGCQQMSHIYRRPRGIYISYPYQNKIDAILANTRFDSVRVIVVSDGERILGLGDQGAGGMGIPIGKLALYSACAGIHPAATLPILLDTGTNNQDRLEDPLYIGWKHERIRGQAYDDFIDAFVQAVKKRFPHVLLQWEDFAQQNAYPLLNRYRHELCTFNDDIQGTAAVATGTVLSAMKSIKARLADQKIVVVGAGSAGCGISQLLLQAMIEDGLTEDEARKRFYLVDRNGLLTDNMSEILPFQKTFLQKKGEIADWDCQDQKMYSLFDVVKNAQPTVMIGVCGQPNTFSEDIIREMAKHCDHPIIFPLSNPTSRSEAQPEDIMRWTNGRAIIGTGSPFGDIQRNGKPFRVDQTNNAYIFPGMGLGLIAVKAKQVTDKMFMVAAKALAECSPAKQDPQANLLPDLKTIREVSFQIAVATAKEAMQSGLASEYPENIEQYIRSQMWEPQYMSYRAKTS